MSNIKTFNNIENLSAALGRYIMLAAQEAVAARGMFAIALSGGSGIKIIGKAIADRIDGSKWHIFWADERCVPLTSEDSNYAGAMEYLLKHIDIPANQIYTIDDSLCAVDAAKDYQAKLMRVFGGLPRFDLILLGIGEDGHTASLFPSHPALNETHKWVAAVLDSPKPPSQRITLTLPVINNARNVVFVAAGKDKAATISKIIHPSPDELLPAQLVIPVNGTLKWFISTDS